MATSGSLIKWFQRTLGGDASLQQLDEEAAAVEPGSGGVLCLPYFLGEKTPINDSEATGAFVGLQLTQSRGHLFRAVLEGIAYGFRHHLDVFAERGYAPRRARVTDGGSKSSVWTQITADIIGIPLEKVTMRSGSAFAAAFCAGMGVGAFKEWRDIERFVSVDEVIEPRPDEAYQAGYRRYRALYPALKEVLT
jgi:xylulokinase